MAADFIRALLPEHILLGLILLLMILELLRADRRVGALLYILSLLAGMGAIVLQLRHGYVCDLIPGEIRVDRFAELGGLLLLGCGLIHAFCSMTTEGCYKYWILVTSSLLGAMVILKSAGFIPLFLGIEILSLPGFALMLINSGKTGATEGAFKYLLLSSVAAALVLFGFSLVYGSSGTLSIAAFMAAVSSGGAWNLAAGLMVLSGFFLKASLFPFHGWAPDAYASARLPVTAFLAGIVKGAVVLGLARILAESPLNGTMAAMVAVLSILSIFYGNITAIHQTAFKRMLAYSSIAHAGYMMFALTGATGGRSEALLYYVAVYAVTTITACACAGLISGNDDSLDALNGAFRTRPAASILLSVCLLSLAGIPPLPGFIAKFFIFRTVVASGLLVPAVIAFTASFIGTFFYLGVIARLFKGEAVADEASQPCCHCDVWGGVILGGAALVLLTVVPGFIHCVLK